MCYKFFFPVVRSWIASTTGSSECPRARGSDEQEQENPKEESEKKNEKENEIEKENQNEKRKGGKIKEK